MRILLAVHGYPPELRGGTEHAVEALARALARAGHEVAIAAGTLADGPSDPPLEEVQAVPGSAAVLRVFRLRRGPACPGHWQRSFDGGIGAAFEALLERLRPDVLHVHHWLRLSRDLVYRAALHGVSAVVTIHDAWSTCLVYFRVRTHTLETCDAPLGPAPCLDCAGHKPDGERTAAAADLLLHRSDMIRELLLARSVFTLCREQIPRLRAALEPALDDVPIVPLPPARELALRRAPRPPPPEVQGKLVIGSWGALYPLKGQMLLLDALGLLLARGVRAELHLAGSVADPDYAAAVHRRAAELGGAAFVHGGFPEGELDRHPVARAHVFASGSIVRETWGFVVDEAVALGLPLVLPRSGAFPEHAPEGRGALHYAPGDACDLADRLENLARVPGELARLAAKLPPLAQVLPSPEAHAARVLAAYGDALERGPPGVAPRDREAEARRAAGVARFERAWLAGAVGGIPGPG